jgi:hypothetical protein
MAMNPVIDLRRSVLALAASVVVLAFAATARSFPGWPSDLPDKPKMYLIDGYLDRTPEGVPALDEIAVAARGKADRKLFVTEYGTPGETMLDMHLSRNMARTYSLTGSVEEVARMIDAPEGAQVRGLFIAYTSGAPVLLIGQLELPAAPGAEPEEAAS